MTGLFEANIAALGRRTDPCARFLARELAHRGPGPDWGLRDRNGKPLAGWMVDGRPRALGSTYAPETEAQRWAEGWDGGTALVFGGAGTSAAAALDARGLRLGFWIEPRIEVWQSLMTWEDWTPWLARDEWVPVALAPADWPAVLKDRYHPLWDGALKSFDWRPAAPAGPDLWHPYRQGTLRALDDLAADGSTQARFGERWFRNSLVNLRALTAQAVPGCPGVRVVVAGAGPGLEDALEDRQNQLWLEGRSETGGRLFAVDTAFPALVARGIVPDLVFSLDGQLPTYHHFVDPTLPPVPLVADLASLPLLGRLGRPVVRYLSGNPLGTIVRRWFPDLPHLDGSLGNVSGLARTTAWALGAREVTAWGVDFGYRDGQAYARGTYVYDLAGRRSNRLDPLETRLSLSAYAARGRERHIVQGRSWDTTPLLRDYRHRWEAPAPVPQPVTLAHGGAEGRWQAFADDWVRRLQTLPMPGPGPFHSFVRGLAPDRRQDWLALWPLALALHRGGAPLADLPEVTRQRALSFLQD